MKRPFITKRIILLSTLVILVLGQGIVTPVRSDVLSTAFAATTDSLFTDEFEINAYLDPAEWEFFTHTGNNAYWEVNDSILTVHSGQVAGDAGAQERAVAGFHVVAFNFPASHDCAPFVWLLFQPPVSSAPARVDPSHRPCQRRERVCAKWSVPLRKEGVDGSDDRDHHPPHHARRPAVA